MPKFDLFTDARSNVPFTAFANETRTLFAFENRNFNISVIDGNTDDELAILPRVEQGIKSLHFSPYGSTLAIDYGKNVQLWNIDSREEIANIQIQSTTNSKREYRLCFSKDGKKLAVRNSQQISVWNIDAHETIATFLNKKGGLWKYLLSADGTLLVTVDHQGSVDLWSVITGKHIHTLTTGYTNRFSRLTYANDSKTIAGTSGSKVNFWDTNTGANIKQFQSPDESGDTNKHVTVERTNASVPWVYGTDIISVAFSKDNSILYTYHTSRKIVVWNIDTENNKLFLPIAGLSTVTSIPIYANPLSKDIITVPLPQTSNNYHLTTTFFNDPAVYKPENTFSQNGELLVSKNKDNNIEVWRIPTQEKLYTLPRQHPNEDYAYIFTFSPNSETLVVCERLEIHLCKAHTGKPIATFNVRKKKPNVLDKKKSLFGSKPKEQKIKTIALAQNGNKYLAASQDKYIYLWDVQKQKLILTIKGHSDEVNQLVFTNDGTVLASGDVGGKIHLWEIPSGRSLTTFKPYTSPITELVFSPDGKTLASTNLYSRFAGTILLWDVPAK